jgi:PhoPQ-activated pathogenicity-related protein
MKRNLYFPIALGCLCLFASTGIAEDNNAIANVPVEIYQYVDRAEPDFAWELKDTTQLGENKIYRLELTSQKWQDIVWKHNLIVYEPTNIVHKEHVMLFINGGGMDSVGKTPKIGDLAMGVALANFSGARIATLHQVPNQPLMGGKKEDDLITETWLKYLETGDATWPLLFPMTKSAVKAMDALEQFSEKQFQQEIKGFVITGASKRAGPVG